MPDRRRYVDWGEQPTKIIPAVQDPAPAPGEPAATPEPAPEPAPEPRAPESAGIRPEGRWRPAVSARWAVPVAVLLGVLALAYLVDLVAGRGEIPRGVRVSGVAIGGMSPAAARQALVSQLDPDLRRDVTVQAGSVRTTLKPADAGLRVDWDATLAAAAHQPLNPITRLASFFTDRDLELVSAVDRPRLAEALDAIDSLVHADPVDGGIRFDGITPVAVAPVPGTALDRAGAAAALTQDWTTGRPVRLPTIPIDPPGHVTPAGIDRALTDLARPAVAAPVRVLGHGRDAALTPEDIAGALSFAPDGAGGLRPVLDVPELADVVRPQLAGTEQPARDAGVSLVGGQPVVTPSVNGRGVDYPATFAGLADVLRRPPDRTVVAVYADQPAGLTTDRVNALGIKGVIGSFTTGGFAADSGQNIKRAAEAINGTIVGPGETFSLDAATGPRGAAQGYVPAGIIDHGHPGRGVGGGISQLATTLYNAAYFAGMTDVEHREHSYYIGRYPVAREATVFEGAIDLKFRNDLPTGVLIETVWTPADITVRIWGTPRYEVTSATSPRSALVEPETLTLPPGEPCTPSAGAPGFTATDTRTMRDLTTGAVTTTHRTVRYQPSPTVVCSAS